MALLDASTWDGRVFNGEWVAPRGGPLPVSEPATGETLTVAGLADADDVRASAQAAAVAQREWAAVGFEEKAAVLRRAGQLIEDHAEEIMQWVSRETGATAAIAGLAQHVAAQECFEASSLPSRAYGSLIPSGQPRLSMTRRLPAGVVGVISPFNVPLILSIRSVAPALALGNSVVLKPDARTPVAGGYVIARVFEEAGLPAGVLHVLPGGGDVGEALVADPDIRIVSFTGSTAAGRKVGEAAGRHLKRAHLELGGNSALVVLDDADLDRAASAGAFGSFIHQGQICMTTGRHLVHQSLVDEYVERLAAKADAITVGDPTQPGTALGPIIDEGQRDKIHSLVTSSADAGAKVRAGGTFEGLFYRPTVVSGVSERTPAWTEEIFGPVAPVASFGSLDEAAQLAGQSAYGLSLGILTDDVMKGIALADRIPSGIVHINDQTVSDEAVAPFGGVKWSGTGARFGGAEANIEAFTETQWLTVQGEITPYPF